MIARTDIIIACDSDYGIGYKNTLPWSNMVLDKQYFKDITTLFKDTVVIMGRKTFESLGNKPLPDRINIVISRGPKTSCGPATSCGSLENKEVYHTDSILSALNLFPNNRKFIIGCSQILDGLMTLMENKQCEIGMIYLNIIDDIYECDTYLPESFIKYLELISGSDLVCHVKIELDDITIYRYGEFANVEESNYLKLLYNTIYKGDLRNTRNSEVYSLFGERLEFDISNSFPLLTSKKMFFRGIFEELMLFIRGQTNSKILEEKGINIWKDNTSIQFLDSVHLPYNEGDMGNMYGYQFRHFSYPYNGMNENYEGKGFDQIEYCLNLIRNDPMSRRILLTSYDPSTANKGVLYPCHTISGQFYVDSNRKLCYITHQRSADLFLGLPFNIASNALFIYLICHVLSNEGINISPGKLVINIGDAHLYKDHKSKAIMQLIREPIEFPKLKFKNKVRNLKDFKYEDISIEHYISYSLLSAKMVA